jgi:mRNA interferase YafQ
MRSCRIWSFARGSKYIQFLALLMDGEELPEEANDHALKGEWVDFREFHVSGDLLIIYQIEKDIIKLVRIGTHSQLFK